MGKHGDTVAHRKQLMAVEFEPKEGGRIIFVNDRCRLHASKIYV